MSLSVINKYITKKEKDLLSYAKILESLISIENNKMWQNKKEFSAFAKEIIEIYSEKYYFQNNIHKENPIEYSNDNINFVLKSIIEYCRLHDKMEMLRSWKNETFLLSVIICTACYVDFASNVVDGDIQDTKNKFKYLLSYLRKTKILEVKDNKYFINDLFDEVKKNASEDKKILEYLDSDDFRNEYKMISNNPVYYEVLFSYEVPGLKEFDETLTKGVLKKYDAKIREISYDLLEVHLLKELISNMEMDKYLIRINKDMKKASLVKFFDNEYLKEFIKILVPYDKEIEYQNIINDYKEIGMNFIYEMDIDEEIEPTSLVNDMQLLVSKEFVKNNANNQMSFEKMNVKLVVKNKEE
ncbi:hypothetical protein EGP99_04505 [bacterium]|nr:hypothetical protein [bacterium]